MRASGESKDQKVAAVSFEDIVAARERIRDTIYLSPCPYSESVSRMTGKRVYFKLENLQMTGSFKERGALNRLLTLGGEERRRGVIAASAGNHGMAVAFHAQRLGIPATIVMPLQAPLIKVTSVRRYGARAHLFGDDFDAALREAVRLGNEEGLTMIHGFDDPAVVSGQGTLGLELLEQNPNLVAVVVSVGGGGLIAGLALAVKKLKPAVRVIGVQAERIPAMKVALAEGKVVEVPPAATIADGIAVRSVGKVPFELVRRYVDDVVTVSEGEIANAVLLLLEIEKTVAEGAAAAPLAALVNQKAVFAGEQVALVVSGGNIDVNVMSRIIDKGLIQEGRLVRVSVIIPDRPGTLARLAQRIGDQGANILDIHHVRGFGEIGLGETEVEIVLETTGPEHILRISETLAADGFRSRTDP